jgi:hypothetical protein
MISTVAIVFIVVGVVLLVALLAYITWPTISAACFGDSSRPLASQEPVRVEKTELPPLVTPV